MALDKVFHKAVQTAFKVFKTAVHDAVYSSVTNDGFDKSDIGTPVRVIISSFTQEDIQSYSFRALIQPTDLQGLIPGVDLPTNVNKNDFITIDWIVYSVVAFQTDPVKALVILLLRKR